MYIYTYIKREREREREREIEIGTMNIIFSFRQLQEKFIEHLVSLYEIFVDLIKAFDIVYGPSGANLAIHLSSSTRSYNSIMTWKIVLASKAHFPNLFLLITRIKQGLNISIPTLFSLYFALTQTFQNISVNIRFRTTDKIFDLTRFHAKSKTLQTFVRRLLSANDADLVAHTEENMQTVMDVFAFGLTTS